MIFIMLLIVSGIIIILRQFGLIGNPFTAFLVATIIIGSVVLIFNNKLHCPFVERCPFHFCPLHK